MFRSKLSRRDFLKVSLGTASGAALLGLPQLRLLAQERPDWAAAAVPYNGQSIVGLAPTGDFANAHSALVSDFETATGITTSIDTAPPGDAYWARVQSEVLGRSGNIQFVAVDSLNFGRYADGGVFLDLTEFLDNPAFPDYHLDDFPENLLDLMARRDGKMYGLPIGGGAQIMFYRTDLLDAAGVAVPTNWEEMLEAARALKTDDVYGAAWEMGGVYAAVRFGNALPADLRWLDADMKLSALRDPRTIAIADIWHTMYAENLIPPDSLATDLIGNIALFQSGRAAIAPVSWPSLVSATENPENSQVAGKVGYAQVPGGAPNASGWTYGILVDSAADPQAAAYLFTTWLTSIEGMRRQLAAGNFDATIRRSSLTDEVKQTILERPYGVSESAGLEALASSWDKARFNPTIPEWPSIINAVSPIIQQIVTGDVEAEAGMNAAADAGEQILSEAGYYA